MDETDPLRAARTMRRAMLGDAYVDSQTIDPDPDPDSVAAEFEDYITSMAWGVWTRAGALTPRDRSLLVMAMTAALAATSEAIAFGRAAGLDMETMLQVLNQSSGRSAASSDKFPDQILTERYAAGFSNSLMAKDVRLCLRAVEELSGPRSMGAVTASVWEDFDRSEPGADFTRISRSSRIRSHSARAARRAAAAAPRAAPPRARG